MKQSGDEFIRWLWLDGRRGLALSVGLAILSGLLAGWLTPRGPLTAAAGIASMLAAFAIGYASGLTMRSRWAMLLAPVVFAIVFEVARSRVDGPTVDGIHFSSTYGFIALATGRGIHGLLALLPMVLGAALGAGLARRLSRQGDQGEAARSTGSRIRQVAAGLTAGGLVLLAVAIAWPAGTDPILGPDGDPLPGSVAELTTVEVGGKNLDLMIRGEDTKDPVLLFLAGGPGGSELGAMRNHLPALEGLFVVATWDQRGTGKSYSELDPTDTMTPDRMVADTIEVTNYLRERFDKEKIYLMGQSWGSLLGVLAVRQQPSLYEAFIGTGQMVSPLETDRIFYRDTLEWARAEGNAGLVETLTENGPPPYESLLDYEPALSYEHEVYPYDRSGNSEGDGGFSENIFAGEYTLLERVHNLAAFLDTFGALYPRIQEIDFRGSATDLEVPVYLIQGRHEADGRAIPANQWFRQLTAPEKTKVVLGTSGHRPLFEQPEEFVAAVRDEVLSGR